MSEITLTIIGRDRTIHGHTHGSIGDRVVAALSADPETIDELELALRRFAHRDSQMFACWGTGVDEEPYDAGVMIVDLVARLVAVESSYSNPSKSGHVTFHNGSCATNKWIPYHLADDWKFLHHIDCWEPLARDRRKAREADPPIDTRAVLYGKVCEFLVKECFAANPSPDWSPPAGWVYRELPERADAEEWRPGNNPIAEIHARWLMTPRADLNGQSPRNVLFEQHRHIERDLQDRCDTWSQLGGAPPALSRQSAAYRFAGFGTHEMVMYYDLVRHLLRECWDRLCDEDIPRDEAAMIAECERLNREKVDWLATPDPEFSGRTPASIIEKERRRIPEAMSAAEAMIDEDCPCCQMMASEDFGPCFWHLDGCNMDDEFPFSIWNRTREEWDEEQRRRREFDEEYERQRQEREAAGGLDTESLWTSGYVNPDIADEPPEIFVMGVAMRIAELTTNLKELAGDDDDSPLVEPLQRHFGNFQEAAVATDSELLLPTMERLCETLASVADAHADLARKGADLERMLRRFADPEWFDPDEIPF